MSKLQERVIYLVVIIANVGMFAALCPELIGQERHDAIKAFVNSPTFLGSFFSVVAISMIYLMYEIEWLNWVPFIKPKKIED